MFNIRSDVIFGKTKHQQEQFHEVQPLQNKYIKFLGNDFKHSEQPRGVKTTKKEEIVSTPGPFLKPYHRQFWENLPINDDSVDLLTDANQSEYVDDSS